MNIDIVNAYDRRGRAQQRFEALQKGDEELHIQLFLKDLEFTSPCITDAEKQTLREKLSQRFSHPVAKTAEAKRHISKVVAKENLADTALHKRLFAYLHHSNHISRDADWDSDAQRPGTYAYITYITALLKSTPSFKHQRILEELEKAKDLHWQRNVAWDTEQGDPPLQEQHLILGEWDGHRVCYVIDEDSFTIIDPAEDLGSLLNLRWTRGKTPEKREHINPFLKMKGISKEKLTNPKLFEELYKMERGDLTFIGKEGYVRHIATLLGLDNDEKIKKSLASQGRLNYAIQRGNLCTRKAVDCYIKGVVDGVFSGEGAPNFPASRALMKKVKLASSQRFKKCLNQDFQKRPKQDLSDTHEAVKLYLSAKHK